MKRFRKAFPAAAALLLVTIAGCVAYVLGTYYRLEDRLKLPAANDPAELVQAGETYTAVTYTWASSLIAMTTV